MRFVTTAQDDESLLLQLSQNSQSAFNQLFEKYWESAFRPPPVENRAVNNR
jgi:hypothetical protein